MKFRLVFSKHRRGVIVSLVLAFLWSWLFLVDVTNLAGSTRVGLVLMLTAYAAIVAISTAVVLKTWRLLAVRLKQPSWKSIIYIVLIWAVMEFLLAWLVSVIWMGREGSWDNIVPFISLTPALMMTPLKFLTRLFGFFGTSAVVGTGILLIVASIKNQKWRKLSVLYWAGIVALNIVMWLVFATANGPSITATITSEYLNEPQKINVKNSDIVVVPEYGLDNYSSQTIQERFADNSKETYFSGTKQYGETSGNSNVLVYGSNQKGFLYEHKKSRLIVGGEYIPFTYELFTRAFAPDVYTDFTVRRAIDKGDSQPGPFTLPSGVVIGNAACSSIINPEDYRKLTAKGATVLANSASLEIFRGSRVFALHHDGLATFMATANARPFLQSANNWKAFALDYSGNKIAQIEPSNQAEVQLKTNSTRTPYSYLGEWLVYTGILTLAGLGIRNLWRVWSTKHKHTEHQS